MVYLPFQLHYYLPIQIQSTSKQFITQRRSVANSIGCFQRRLFVCLCVCQHDNFRTSKHRTMKLGGDAMYKNLGQVRIWGS